MAHALNSPSTLHRRLACPGSANAEKDLPDVTSKYAEEGTKAHEIAAALLLGQTAEIEAEPAEDLLSAVQHYVDTVQATVASLDGHLIVEQQVDYSLYAPAGMDARGTLDSAVISNDVLVICDYKHGRGVPVFATDNPQLRAYALGVHSLYGLAYDYERVRLEIHQPRIGNHSTEELSVAELERWGHEVLRPGLEATLDPDAVRVAGDHCTFCKARGSCQRLAEFVEETVTAQFDDLTVEPAQATGLISIGVALSRLDTIETWIKAVRETALQKLAAGIDIPGWKRVAGRRGARQWTEEKTAEETLKAMRLKVDEMYNFEVKSPTQIEKLLKDASPRRWAKLQPLIVQKDGSPTLAPASDKRPALPATAAQFEDLSNTNDSAQAEGAMPWQR
jgi:hypothetical protein